MKEGFNSPTSSQTHTVSKARQVKEGDARYIWDYMSVMSVTKDSKIGG